MGALLTVSLTVSLGLSAQTLKQNVQQLLRAKFPQSEVTSIRQIGPLHLWEAYVGGQLVYVDPKQQYILAGSLYDAKTLKNLTDERLTELRAVKFENLPFQLAVVLTKGTGKRKFAVFEDPFCGFCRALEPELDKLEDYTAYIFITPILGDPSKTLAKNVWCQPNHLIAWQEALRTKDRNPEPLTCENPVGQLNALGRRLGVDSTPTLVFADGSRHAGFMKADQLENMLEKPN
jgi:thiol:disulfide interchange protein DsbC